MHAKGYAWCVQVLTGHQHNYERSYTVFNESMDSCAPMYLVVGDGGNEEGGNSDFLPNQPRWSAYRSTEFGQGNLVLFNDSTAQWTWHANDGTALDQVSAANDLSRATCIS